MPLRKATAVTAILLAASAAPAREWVSEEHKCAMAYPDDAGWTVADERPDPSCVFLLVSGGDEGIVYVNVTDVGTRIWLSDEVIAGFERGALGSKVAGVESVRKVSGRRTEHAGVPAYELVASLVLNGTPMRITSLVLAANSRTYTVNSLAPETDGAPTAQARAITSSFRFTSPPDVHEKSEPFAYRMGQLAGGILMIALVLLVVKRAVKR